MANTITVNTYQIQVGFMAPTTGSMLIPAKTREEAERKAIDHINQQFTNGTIIHCHLISTEEVPEDNPQASVEAEQSVVLPFIKPKST